jgi:type IV pilus assembly protein PilE
MMKNQTAAQKFESSGFTLIELMVTLAIAAILVTVAIPAYNSQIRKSRRTEAKTALLDLAGREERVYSATNAYSNVPSALGYTVTPDSFPLTVGSGYYTVNVVVNAPGAAATFTITALPVGGQGQDKDTLCTSFVVDQTGQQTASDPSCWR